MENKFECYPENDTFLDTIRKAVLSCEGYPRIINPKRYQEMLIAKKAIDDLLAQNGYESSTIRLEPTFCMGSVVAEIDDLEVHNSAAMQTAIFLASNFEIYPLTNGKMRMAFTFNRLMTILK